MIAALTIIAYLGMGWLSVFTIEYLEPDSEWERGAIWAAFLVWPVVAMFLAVAGILYLAKRSGPLSPISAAQAVRQNQENRKRVIVKGRRGVEDG